MNENSDNILIEVLEAEATTVDAESEFIQPSNETETISVGPSEQSFTLSEVAEFLGIKESKLRYWEEAFAEFLQNHRNQYNHRVFTKADIDILQRIKDLYDSALYTTDGVKYVLRKGDFAVAQTGQTGESSIVNLPAVIDEKFAALRGEISEEVRGEFVKALNSMAGELQLLRREMREDLLSSIKEEMDHMTNILMPPKLEKKPWWRIF